MSNQPSEEELDRLLSSSGNPSEEELDRLLSESEKVAPSSDGFSLKRMAKGAVETLPLVGAGVGGALGLGSPIPGGAIGGAALGGYLGKSLENLVEGTVLNEPKTRTEIYAEPFQAGLEGAAGEAGGKIVSDVVVPSAMKGLKSVSSSLSKMPEKVMETYYKRAPEVAKISAESETSLAEAANALRQKALDAIDSFKNIQNSKISQAVQSKQNDLVNISSVKKVISDNISKLDPVINEDQVSKLQKQRDLLHYISDSEGNVTAKQAYAVQKSLQDMAEYIPPGQPFKRKDFTDLTFQKAAAYARKNLQNVVPEISEANAELMKIRKMDKNINKNLITPDRPFASILGVGTGENQMNVSQMQKLGDIVGTDLVSPAENIAAAKYFNQAGLLPSEKTGSSLAPLILAGSAGAGGYLAEGDLGGAAKGLALGALASPLGIKAGILGARSVGKYAPTGAAQMAEQMLSRAIQAGIPPFLIDSQIRDSEALKPTEKAILRSKNMKSGK